MDVIYFVSDSIRRTTYNTKLKHTATLKSSQANVSCNRSIPSLFCWEIGKQNVLCPLAAKIFVAENIKWGWDFHKKTSHIIGNISNGNMFRCKSMTMHRYC